MNFFCRKRVKPLFTIAGFSAGYLIAKNNPDFTESALSVINALLNALKEGSDEEVMNALFREAILDLVESNPPLQMNLLAILDTIAFDIKAPEASKFSMTELKAMICSFKNGLMAVKLEKAQ